MSTSNSVRRAVHRALLTSAIAATAATSLPAAAQDDAIQEVIVTGSRIIRSDYVANSPLTSVTEEQITQNQDVTLDTFLNTLPQVNPAGTTTSNNPGNNGQSNIDLRGLGANRNLVLIDGRRAMVSASNQTVDLNTIPAALVERIEIITGGAGAAYGADAVAGAVNLILKKDFEGVDVRAGWADTEDYDAHEYNAGLTIGANFAENKGNAVVAFEYSEREGLIKSQRDFAAIATSTTTFLPEGLYSPSGNAPSQAAVNAVFGSYGVAPGAVANSSTLIGFNQDGTLFSRGLFNSPLDVQNFRYPVDLAVNSNLFPDVYSYNFDSVNILTLPLERRSMMLKFDYDVGGSVEVFSQFGYTEYESAAALAPTPISTIITTAPGETRNAGEATSPLVAPGGRINSQLVVPVTNPFIPADFRTLLASRTGNNPGLVGSGPTEAFLMRQRTLTAGLRQSTYENTVAQYLFGARGDITGSWRWEAYASEGRTEINELQTGNIDQQTLNDMLNAPDGGASMCAGGFNPFGRQPISSECLGLLQVNNTLTNEFKQQIVQAFVSGEVFDLPAGPVSVVLGAEYRGFRYSLDPGAAGGPISGFNVQNPALGTNKFEDIFTEALIPILSDAPFAKSLDVSIGYRLSSSEFKDLANGLASDKSDDDAYKVELSWAPVDFLRTRASYQRAVRAPNFTELFDGGGSNPQYFDPCSVTSNARAANNTTLRELCRTAGSAGGLGAAVDTYVQTPGTQVSITLAGNTALKPETADTYTIGAVFTSPWDGIMSSFRASLDYYKIDVADAMLTPDTNLYVADCYNYYGDNPSFDPNHPSCIGLFRGGDILAVENPDDPDGFFPTVNAGSIKTDGIDLQVEWGTDVGPGSLALQFYMNYLLSWKQQALPGFPELDYAGTATFFGAGDGLGQSFPELRANIYARYALGDTIPLSFDVRSRFIDGMDNRAGVLYPGETAFTGPSSIVYWDFGVTWNFVEKGALRLGVNNAFNKEPETYAPNVQSGTDPSLYDVIGRRIFMQASMQF